MRAPRLEKRGSGEGEGKRGEDERRNSEKGQEPRLDDHLFTTWGNKVEDEGEGKESKKNNRACVASKLALVRGPSACQCVKVRNKDKFVSVRSPPDVLQPGWLPHRCLLRFFPSSFSRFYLSIKMSTGCCVRWATSRPI